MHRYLTSIAREDDETIYPGFSETEIELYLSQTPYSPSDSLHDLPLSQLQELVDRHLHESDSEGQASRTLPEQTDYNERGERSKEKGFISCRLEATMRENEREQTFGGEEENLDFSQVRDVSQDMYYPPTRIIAIEEREKWINASNLPERLLQEDLTLNSLSLLKSYFDFHFEIPEDITFLEIVQILRALVLTEMQNQGQGRIVKTNFVKSIWGFLIKLEDGTNASQEVKLTSLMISLVFKNKEFQALAPSLEMGQFFTISEILTIFADNTEDMNFYPSFLGRFRND